MSLRVLFTLATLVWAVAIGQPRAADDSANEPDSVDIILFWSGASMHGHIIQKDDKDNEIVIERTDGKLFSFDIDDVFAITDEAGYDAAYDRLKSTPRPNPREVMEGTMGLGFIKNDNTSNLKILAGVGVRFAERVRLGLVAEYNNDLNHADIINWMLSLHYYIPVGKRALYLFAQPGLAVRGRETVHGEETYGFTLLGGIGIRSGLSEPVALFAQIGYQHVNIGVDMLTPEAFEVKEGFVALSVGVTFSMINFDR